MPEAQGGTAKRDGTRDEVRGSCKGPAPVWGAPLPGFVLAAVLASLPTLQACTTVPSVVRVEEGDSTRPIELTTGQMLEIRLLDPGRGTRITLGSVVAPTLVQVGEPAFHDDPVRDGVSGTGNYEAWLFRAAAPGSVDLRLDFRLQWEATGTPGRSVTYRVAVK